MDLPYARRAIITRSELETTLDYKPQIFGQKIEEYRVSISFHTVQL